jgi:hypothetical protein
MRRSLAVLLALALAPAWAMPARAQGSARACSPALSKGVLPTWARTGFSDPRPKMPHVLGRSDEIAAVIFGYPLLSPPAETRANKILWVSRRTVKPLSDLRIRAQRMRGTRRVGRHVVRVIRGGPGPSYLNLPSSGCWRLALSWSGRSDSLDLDYRRRS